MRVLVLSLAGFLLACPLSFVPLSALASGNVIVPADDANLSSSPNLGLKPRPKKVEPPETKELEKVEEETVQPLVQPLAPPPPQNPPATPKQKETPPATPSQGTLQISMVGGSSFGSADMANITGRLGIYSPQIPSACSLGFKGTLSTSASVFDFNSQRFSQTSVTYSGKITSASIYAHAFCHESAVPNEKKSSYQKTGAFYVVPLGFVTCDSVPTTPFSKLNVSYNAPETGCSFE